MLNFFLEYRSLLWWETRSILLGDGTWLWNLLKWDWRPRRGVLFLGMTVALHGSILSTGEDLHVDCGFIGFIEVRPKVPNETGVWRMLTLPDYHMWSRHRSRICISTPWVYIYIRGPRSTTSCLVPHPFISSVGHPPPVERDVTVRNSTLDYFSLLRLKFGPDCPVILPYKQFYYLIL